MLVLLSFTEKSKNKFILKFTIFLLWFMATFRSLNVGNDTRSYYNLFNILHYTQDYTEMTWRFEEGFLFINKTISRYTNNFTIFLGIINSYIYMIYYYFIKNYSKNYCISLFLFITLGIWANTISILRLELAVTVVLTGYMMYDLKKANKLIATIYALISPLFQRISIVYSLGFLVPKRLSKKFIKWSSVIAIISIIILPYLMNIIGKIIPYFYEHYLYQGSKYLLNDVKLASVIKMFIYLSIFCFGILFYKSDKNKYYYDNDLALQLNMTWVSFLILFVSLRFNLLDRCSYFFSVFSIVLIPNTLRRMKLKNNRIIITLLLVFLFTLYFIIIAIYKPEWNNIYPYSFNFTL
ncbi:EpsG family protein [Anaerococcus porci]|nr:EpsG family protein [Anaerococcus porci]